MWGGRGWSGEDRVKRWIRSSAVTHLNVSAKAKLSILSLKRILSRSRVTSSIELTPAATLAEVTHETYIFHPFSCHFRSPVSRYLASALPPVSQLPGLIGRSTYM